MSNTRLRALTKLLPAALLLCLAVQGKVKKLPSGDAGNDVVQISASALDSEALISSQATRTS